jgi:hypothetical protein
VIAEAAHRNDAIALTRFTAIVAQFGRFLPRLGPFGIRTAFLYWQLLRVAVESANARISPPESQIRILRRADLQKSHLLVMRCTFNFCSAICELCSRFAALLGRFLPRLGPFVKFGRPFFFGESGRRACAFHSAAAR